MFGIPGIKLLIVGIISELRVLTVRLYELDRLQIGEATVQMIQIKHEADDRVVRAVVLQKIDAPTYDEAVQYVIESTVERERESARIGRVAGCLLVYLALLVAGHLGATIHRTKLDNNRLLN